MCTQLFTAFSIMTRNPSIGDGNLASCNAGSFYSQSEMQFFLVDDDLEAWILSSLRIPNLIEWSILRLPLLIQSCGHYYHNVRQQSLFLHWAISCTNLLLLCGNRCHNSKNAFSNATLAG